MTPNLFHFKTSSYMVKNYSCCRNLTLQYIDMFILLSLSFSFSLIKLKAFYVYFAIQDNK